MSTVTISIPDQLKKFVSAQMRKKGFDNMSEYFRSLVREAQAKEADTRLEALMLEGVDSRDLEASEEFWKDLKSEAKALVKKHSQRKLKKAA